MLPFRGVQTSRCITAAISGQSAGRGGERGVQSDMGDRADARPSPGLTRVTRAVGMKAQTRGRRYIRLLDWSPQM